MAEALKNGMKTRQERALDERHLQDAEQDCLGNPVIKRGKTFDHAKEVANSRNGLERDLEELQREIDHEENYVDRKPDGSIDDAKSIADKLQKFLDEIDRKNPEIEKRKTTK